MNKNIVIDAEGAVLGRLASYAAKQSLLGKTISIVNSEKAIITGRRQATITLYKHKRSKGGAIQRGPNFPSSTDKILKRTIRGMLSYKQGRGDDAFRRIKTYNGIPAQFASAEKISLKSNVKARSTTLREVANDI